MFILRWVAWSGIHCIVTEKLEKLKIADIFNSFFECESSEHLLVFGRSQS